MDQVTNSSAVTDVRATAYRPRVVIVGGGFAGVAAVRALKHCDADVVLIDRRNHHIFQPLLYQVATAVLAPSEVRYANLHGSILASFDESLSDKVKHHLQQRGIEVRTGVTVELVDEHGVVVRGERIASKTVLWTAGIQASAIVKQLGVSTDRAGRASVGPLLSVANHPEVFVVGDAAAATQEGHPLPGIAQVAIQEGRFVGRAIEAQIQGRPFVKPFRYRDRGNMAVVGKNFAVLQRGRLCLSGLLTWLVWALFHVMFLPQLQNRVRVQTQWLWSYLTGQRSSRLIPERNFRQNLASGGG